MQEKFLEFRLCEGDWKVEKYGSIKYSDWDKGHRTGGQLKRMLQLLCIISQYFRFYLGDRPSMNVNAASRKRKHEEDEHPLTKLKKTKRPQSETVISLDSDGEESRVTLNGAIDQSAVRVFLSFLNYLLLHQSSLSPFLPLPLATRLSTRSSLRSLLNTRAALRHSYPMSTQMPVQMQRK